MTGFIKKLEDKFKPRDDEDNEGNDDDIDGGAGAKGGNKPYIALVVLLIVRFF